MGADLEGAVCRGIDRAARPAQWGVDDCALWVAGILEDAFGYDAAEQWRTGYSDRAGADASLGALGLAGALRRVAKERGWERIDADQATTCDVGVVMLPALVDGKSTKRATTVICRAPGWFMARSARGIAAWPVEAVKPRLCWRVR